MTIRPHDLPTSLIRTGFLQAPHPPLPSTFPRLAGKLQVVDGTAAPAIPWILAKLPGATDGRHLGEGQWRYATCRLSGPARCRAGGLNEGKHT
jgi:hypothetical protein